MLCWGAFLLILVPWFVYEVHTRCILARAEGTQLGNGVVVGDSQYLRIENAHRKMHIEKYTITFITFLYISYIYLRYPLARQFGSNCYR